MTENGQQDEQKQGRRWELARLAEALIFAADDPVAPEQIAQVFGTVTGLDAPAVEEIEAAIAALNAAYEAGEHALRVQQWAGGYRLSTTADVAPYLKAFFYEERRRRLSRSLMETLAILSYRQPVTKPEIDFVRGVDSDYALRKLMEMGFVDVVGRSDSVGRPLLYGTTPAFLEAFGLNTLDDLPNLREVEDMLADPAFNKERARLLMLKGIRVEDDALEDADHVSDETSPTPDSEEAFDEEA